MRGTRYPDPLFGWDDEAPRPGDRPLYVGVRGDAPPMEGVDRPPELLTLARIALDYTPEAGDEAAPAILGPWDALLDLRRPGHMAAVRVAVAASALTCAPGQNRSAVRAWARDRPRALPEDRRRVAALLRAPWAPWEVVEVGEDGWHVRPLLPLLPRWVPEGPVRVGTVGAVDGPGGPGGLLFARVLPCEAGPVAALPFVLPATPSRSWWRAVLAHHAQDAGGPQPVTVERALRQVGHRLCAEVHAWWWWARTDPLWRHARRG